MSIGCLDKRFVDDPIFVSPKVAATEVVKGKPNSGMHIDVIRSVLTFDWRMVSGDLPTAGRMGVGEVGTRDTCVAKDIRGDGASSTGNDQTISLLLDGKLRTGCLAILCANRCPKYGSDEQQRREKFMQCFMVDTDFGSDTFNMLFISSWERPSVRLVDRRVRVADWPHHLQRSVQ